MIHVRNWLKHLAEIARCAWRLRPHLRGGRYLILAVIISSLGAGMLEGVGVGLLVPLLSLLLGGEDAAPMRPIRMLRDLLPGHQPSFYVIAFCALVLGAIAGKNAVLYLSQALAARLRKRISTNLRASLFQRLHRAELLLFEQRTAGEIANVFFTETARTIAMLSA